LTPETQTTSSELFQACETIFGPDVNVSIEFLEYLQPIGIKTAYRKRALETHPDRAKALGSFARDLNTEFIDVQQAYEKLLLFVETNNGCSVSTQSFSDFKTQQAPPYQSSEKSSYTSSYQNTRQHKGRQKKSPYDQRSTKKQKPSRSFLHRQCPQGKPYDRPVFILLRSYFMANAYRSHLLAAAAAPPNRADSHSLGADFFAGCHTDTH
jgi:hypothetical protein